MMAQSRPESTRDTYNYGQYLNQFPPNTIKVIREFERIQKRICRHKMSIMFNEICINEEMLPKYTYIYIYIYISSSSSSSRRAASTDIPDLLSPFLPIFHRFRKVFRATSRILTQLLNVCSSWLFCFCPAICWGSIGVYHLWVHPCFSNSVLHVWFV